MWWGGDHTDCGEESCVANFAFEVGEVPANVCVQSSTLDPVIQVLNQRHEFVSEYCGVEEQYGRNL